MFVNWGQGEYGTGQNQYCSIISNALNGQWKTVNCEAKSHGYICEKQQKSFTTKRFTTMTTVPGVQYDCQPDWQYFKNSYCYKFFDGLGKFDEAKAYCRKVDAELVEVFNEEENDFVLYIINQAVINIDGKKENSSDVDLVWLGMYDTLIGFNQVSFKWNSGKQPSYTNWAKGQPEIHSLTDDDKCVSIIQSDRRKSNIHEVGQWIVTKCDYKLSYACRKPVSRIESTVKTTLTPGCSEVNKSENKVESEH